MNTKNFWQVSVEYKKGSCFFDVLIVEEYQDYDMACYAFSDFERYVYHAFEKYYENSDIFVHSENCANDVCMTTIKAKNKWLNKKDVCRIKKELKTEQL